MAPETKHKYESEDLFENSDIVIACTVMSDRPKGIMESREPDSKTLVARMACGDRGYSTASTSHIDRGVMSSNTEQTVVEENDVYTVHATQTHKSELESVKKEK